MRRSEKLSFGILCAICVFSILAYQAFRCHEKNKDFKDPLLIQYGIWDIDGWSITHIVFFALLGYLYTKHFVIIMIMGILWELIEDNVMHILTKDISFLNCKILTTDNVNSKTNNIWWFGRFSDVLMDLFGFGIGYLIRNKIMA